MILPKRPIVGRLRNLHKVYHKEKICYNRNINNIKIKQWIIIKIK